MSELTNITKLIFASHKTAMFYVHLNCLRFASAMAKSSKSSVTIWQFSIAKREIRAKSIAVHHA